MSAAASSGTGYFESYDRQKLDPCDRDGFASAMVSFCRSNKVVADALLVGNVQMLGLDKLKEAFGPERGGKVKGRAHLLTETIIKKLITTNDLYVQPNDEQFIVLFGKATKEEATVLSKKIVEEVNRQLNGAGAGAELVTVKSMVVELPRDEPEKLTQVIELTQSVEEAQGAAEQAERDIVTEIKDELKVTFWPVANVRKKMISMYMIHIDTSVDTALEVQSDTGAMEAELDTLALERASKALVEAAGRKWRAMMILPVHLETLNVKRFHEAYLDNCRLLPQLASGRLSLYVIDMPDDVPQSKLHTMFSYFAPFFAGFICGFSRGFKRSEQLQGINLLGVAAEGSTIVEVSPGTVMELRDFAQANGEGRTRTFFTEAQNFDVGLAARRANFDYVQGPGVAKAMGIFGKVMLIPG